MKELTKEQAIKYLSQFINEFGYNSFSDLIQNQKSQLDIYANKMNIPSNAVTLDIKLKNPPYRQLWIRIDFVNKNIELRNYNVYSNSLTVSFSELTILDRFENLKSMQKE